MVDKLNYHDVLALNLNGYISSLQPKAWIFVICQFTSSLICHRLQYRNKKLEQFSEERDIVSKIQISKGSLAKCHPNRGRFNCLFQQPIHAWQINLGSAHSADKVRQ